MTSDSDGYSRWLKETKREARNLFLMGVHTIKSSHKDSLFYFRSIAVFLFLLITLGAGLLFGKAEGVGQESLSSAQASSLFVTSEKSKPSPASNFIVMQDSSIKATLPPVLIGDSRTLGVFTVAEAASGGIAGPREGIVEYVVQPGDTPSSVAESFQISLETLFWANDLTRSSQLKVGQKLIILPVDGVLHHVKDGDTISSIAKTYQADIERILAFNDLSSEGDIYIGDILIIPGGKMPPRVPKAISQPTQVAVADSYFLYPLGGPRIRTQGLHWYNAVDLKGECGDPIYAVAEGRVLKVATTSSTSKWALQGAGNHLTILHPNGVVTYYGHLAASLVAPGQEVTRGQRIATVGGRPGTPGAGLSTGCHLHFGVKGARNPFAR